MSKPIAIFTTSEIQRFDHETNEAVTTGALERAMEHGFKCFVVSTRPVLGEHDKWWQKLVGESNVFLAINDKDYEERIERTDFLKTLFHWGGKHDYRNSYGWSQLYDVLLEQWPYCEGRPEYWTQARARLRELGYVLGHEFDWNSVLVRNDSWDVRYKHRLWGPEYVQYNVQAFVTTGLEHSKCRVRIASLHKWIPEWEENVEHYQSPKPSYLGDDHEMKYVSVTNENEVESFLATQSPMLMHAAKALCSTRMDEMKARRSNN